MGIGRLQRGQGWVRAGRERVAAVGVSLRRLLIWVGEIEVVEGEAMADHRCVIWNLHTDE
jgi:hypothetical protein